MVTLSPKSCPTEKVGMKVPSTLFERVRRNYPHKTSLVFDPKLRDYRVHSEWSKRPTELVEGVAAAFLRRPVGSGNSDAPFTLHPACQWRSLSSVIAV